MKSRNLMSLSPSSIFSWQRCGFSAFYAGPASAASEPGTVTIVLQAEPRHIDPGNSEGTYGQVMTKNVWNR